MSASPYDGLYSDNNMPLGLVKTLQDLLKKNANNPNIPNPWVPSSDRQWLSVPRSPSSYSLRHSVYTFSDAPNYFNPDGSPKFQVAEPLPEPVEASSEVALPMGGEPAPDNVQPLVGTIEG